MIYNYWVAMVTDFEDELTQAYGDLNSSWMNEGVLPPAPVAATTYPLINVLASILVTVMRSAAAGGGSFTAPVGWKLYNCYSSDSDLTSQVPVREGLQELEETYPQAFQVLGAWEFGGQPIGGVGSPWFATNPNTVDFMPEGVLDDVILLAGQNPRQFV